MRKFTEEEVTLLRETLHKIDHSPAVANRKLFTVTAMGERFSPLVVDEFVRLDTERLRAELVSEYMVLLKTLEQMSYLEEKHINLNSASFISKQEDHTYIYLKDRETIFSIRVESVDARLERLEEEYLKESRYILALEQDSLSE